MMSANYISTLMLSSSLRSSITNNQAALSRASTEATTGRFYDVGLELGATTGSDLSCGQTGALPTSSSTPTGSSRDAWT